MRTPDPPEVLERFHRELELVEIVARQVRREVGPVLEHDELLSFGREGLLQAARSYEPERGLPFRKWANYRVRGAMFDGMRSSSHLPRRAYEKVRALQAANEIADALAEDLEASIRGGLRDEAADAKLADHLATVATAMALPAMRSGASADLVDKASETPEAIVERQELVAKVMREIDGLPEAEATLVRKHFFEDENIDQIAQGMGLSKSWGSRVLARGVATLSKRLVRAA